MRAAELQYDLAAVVDDGVSLTVVLPWPPSVNSYWAIGVMKTTLRTFIYKTKKAKRYCEDVVLICGGRARKFSADSEVLLDITLHPPDARRRDADNFNKGVWDSLVTAGVLADDSQVQSYRVTKGRVHPGGRVVVKIWERERDAGT